jgi:hypothetical protein
MRTLTPEGHALVEGVARRNNFGTDAALTLLAALDRGNGTQAQFNHFELGGMGQWSRGGMIMIGDMFNNGLKYRVDQLCNELSDLLRTQANLFAPEPAYGGSMNGGSMNGGSMNGGSMNGGGTWWPASYGQPSASGGQNDMQYACFPDARRLAIRRGGQVTLYDTGDHRITGFSQQQGGDQNLTFSSQYGTVRLYDLGLITGEDQGTQRNTSFAPPPVYPQQVQPEPAWQPAPSRPAFTQPTFQQPEPSWQPAPGHGTSAQEDMFAKIERLYELQQKGILSEAEYAAKKKDLLDRL